MRFNDNECNAILKSIHKIENGQMNKLKAFKEIKDIDVNIKQSSYFSLVDKILVLSRLKHLNVEDYIIDDVANMMNVFYIWRLYNE